ncbi:putative transcription factor C2C2-YABBY family [Rosa chinensis]|uniref:Putative transcription factor C2C2-YABBY family n=1 Tax=Rosa chinensis TaxID=74649 RepID=A0A2P6R3H2_ROSCH|nr:putative transcription factor C2C2-YABBY family [Rosa chinensis]
MTTLNGLFDLPEQICYVQCGFCATILLVILNIIARLLLYILFALQPVLVVSVPCSSLSRLVTVRCGHCSCLLSVNMLKASFLPFHLLASLGQNVDQEKDQEICVEEVEEVKYPGLGDMRSPSMAVSNNSENEEYTNITLNHIVNKPPEKRQRAPSAYNRFIKEEIQRLKAENPSMTHKEAFSTAAKNVGVPFSLLNHLTILISKHRNS